MDHNIDSNSNSHLSMKPVTTEKPPYIKVIEVKKQRPLPPQPKVQTSNASKKTQDKHGAICSINTDHKPTINSTKKSENAKLDATKNDKKSDNLQSQAMTQTCFKMSNSGEDNQDHEQKIRQETNGTSHGKNMNDKSSTEKSNGFNDSMGNNSSSIIDVETFSNTGTTESSGSNNYKNEDSKDLWWCWLGIS